MEDYQLERVVRAVDAPRVNLLLADGALEAADAEGALFSKIETRRQEVAQCRRTGPAGSSGWRHRCRARP